MYASYRCRLFYAFTVLCVGCIARTELLEAAPNSPNILLIVADDLGFSDLGCYGGEIATPNLDALAADGIRLTQFYTTGRCCPSRACLLTGFYPHRVGLGHMTQDIGQPGYRGRVAEDVLTIAQHLQQCGYRSFLSGKWHLGTDDPTRHGFEEFYGTLVSAKTFWDPDHFLRLPKGRKITPQRRNFYGTDALGEQAITFLNQARETPDRPWFLYLAFNAPHFPLHAPPETIAKYVDRYTSGWDVLRAERLGRMQQLGIVPPDTQLSPRSRYADWVESLSKENPAWKDLPSNRQADLARRMAIYAAMVDHMDQAIGRVLDDLKSHDEFANSLIVFTSDNGGCAEWDPFGFDIKSGPKTILHENDELAHMGSAGTFHSVGSGWANASNTPWRLYKHFNHEGGIAVPCILHGPSVNQGHKGTIHSTPTHLIDLLPTILESAGISETVDTKSLPGQSLHRVMRGQPLPNRKLFFEHEGNRAVRDGRWKLVALRDHAWELYDISVDRIEQHDLASKYPEKVRSLATSWSEWANGNHVTPLPRDYNVEYLPKNPRLPVKSK